jgi:hypothetical protein
MFPSRFFFLMYIIYLVIYIIKKDTLIAQYPSSILIIIIIIKVNFLSCQDFILCLEIWLWLFFTHKCIKIIFFYFLKIIFDINASK